MTESAKKEKLVPTEMFSLLDVPLLGPLRRPFTEEEIEFRMYRRHGEAD